MDGLTTKRTLSHGTPKVPVNIHAALTDLERIRLRKAVREKMSRSIEPTQLYVPLPNQLAFHQSQAKERLLRGSNRAGKTLAASMEIAWILSNRHPYIKYPKGGKIIAVGRSEEHIGNVMWDKLAKPQYNMKRIKDLETGQWRAYRPWDEADVARVDEALPMPPLVPERLIAGEPAWISKKEQIPKSVQFKTGWKLMFFTGGGNPPQGMSVDVIWFDEEIERNDWYTEMAARLPDMGGRFIWSATAQAGGDQLWNLHQRAMEDEGALTPAVSEHPILLMDNPYISQQAKDELAEKFKHDPDAYRVRILGEYLITSFHVYPTFSVTEHCCEPFEIPADWCRYMIVDPGTVVAAVLFVAVPPDQSHLYVYDEIYLRDSNPQKWAEAVRQKCQGQLFQEFIIDDNGSRRTEATSGLSVRQVYADILKNIKVESRATGHSFRLGQSNVLAGLDQVRKFLGPKPKSKDGRAYIQIFMPGCPNLVEEFPRYHKKRSKVTGLISEEPAQKHNHALDCFDSETEVLTDLGWQKFADLGYDRAVATVNMETDKIEFQWPTERIQRWHDGEMVRIKCHKLDYLVTPNHRMIARAGNAKTAKQKFVLAKNLKPAHCLKLVSNWEGRSFERIHIPKSPDGVFDSVDVDPGDFAEFIGWYVSEGCAVSNDNKYPGRGYQVCISQNPGESYERIRSLLDRLPFNFHCKKDGLAISDKRIWDYVRNECHTSLNGERGCYTKKVPIWIKDACPEIINRFIESAILGDGWVQGGGRSYATTSKQLADDIQELFLRIGKNASVSIGRPAKVCAIKGKEYQCKEQYWVREWNTPVAHMRNSKGESNVSTEHYTGFVFCVSVPNETLIVRRNGKVLIAGNCLRYAVMHGCPYVKPKAIKRRSAAGKFMEAKRKKRKKQQGEKSIILG